LTQPGVVDVEGWANRHRIAAPWLVEWAFWSAIEYHGARQGRRPRNFYDRWDWERARNPEVWLADFLGIESLCPDLNEDDGAEPDDEHPRTTHPHVRRNYDRYDLLARFGEPEDLEHVERREEFVEEEVDRLLGDDEALFPRPSDAQHDEAIDRLVEKVHLVIQERARLELTIENATASPKAKKRSDLDRHCKWTVRRYLRNESVTRIARSEGDTATPKAVEGAITRIAALLNLPRLPKGRPPKTPQPGSPKN
jgi:hypothetical protein